MYTVFVPMVYSLSTYMHVKMEIHSLHARSVGHAYMHRQRQRRCAHAPSMHHHFLLNSFFHALPHTFCRHDPVHAHCYVRASVYLSIYLSSFNCHLTLYISLWHQGIISLSCRRKKLTSLGPSASASHSLCGNL